MGGCVRGKVIAMEARKRELGDLHAGETGRRRDGECGALGTRKKGSVYPKNLGSVRTKKREKKVVPQPM